MRDRGMSSSSDEVVEASAVLAALGVLVARRRIGLSLTQAELAQLAGVNRVTISRIERGRMDVGVTTLHRLARALGTSPAELLDADKPDT